jgi:TRAP-type C4-dicarboxylate transport system permease small subunit
MKRLEKIIDGLSSFFNGIALTALTVTLIIVAVNIVAGKLFSMPLPGAIDLVSLLSVIVIGFALPQSYRMDRHIKVEFMTWLMPPGIRKIVQLISQMICMLFFGFIVWRMFIYADYVWTYGEKSLTLKIPLYPFIYALAISMIPMLLIVPMQIINTWKNDDIGKNGE